MKEIRRSVTVQPGGRVEITDPSLEAGGVVEVVVTVPEGSGDGAPTPPDPDEGWDAGMLTFEELEALPPLPFDQIVGSAPSGRTAEEIDRDLRALRDEWDEPYARRESRRT